MLGIVGLAALLVVLGLSLAITRIATVALTLTGLSREVARFQARSAFTGTGFTTEESEQILNHPVRRRIIMILMILRSAGLISIIISLILTFGVAESGNDRLYNLLWLLAGVTLLWVLARSALLERYMNRLIRKALEKWTSIDTRDYARLLNLSGDYGVTELQVGENSWIAGKRLREMDLIGEGIMVLGINRNDGQYVGVPQGDSKVSPGDTMILYGRGSSLHELDERRSDMAGEKAHEKAVDEQNDEMKKQEQQEKEHEEKQQKKEKERNDEKETSHA